MRFFEKSGWLLLSLTLSLSVSCSKTDVKSGQEERSAGDTKAGLSCVCEDWVIYNQLCGFWADFVYPCDVPDQSVYIAKGGIILTPQCLTSDCGPVCPTGIKLPGGDIIEKKDQDAIWCYPNESPPCPDGSDPCNGEGWKICYDFDINHPAGGEFIFVCYDENPNQCIDCNN